MNEDSTVVGSGEGGETGGVNGAGSHENQSPGAGQAAKTLLAGGVAGDSASDSAGGGHNAGATAAEAKQPEVYTLTPPEGSLWDTTQMDAFHGHAKELGLSQEQAQKLLDVSHANQKAGVEAHWTQVNRWADDIRTDKEMGGSALEGTIMSAKAGIAAFDTEGRLLGMLEETGYANHPDVLRFLSRVGRAMGEDSFVTGKRGGSSAPLEDRLYKNMKL